MRSDRAIVMRARFLLLSLLVATSTARASIGPNVLELEWLAGSWCSDAGGGRVEEVWLRPANGPMIGMSRTVGPGARMQFEFLRIEMRNGAPVYLAQPGGGEPVAFAWSGSGASWMRFENRAHDFPQRIEYRRDGEELVAEVSGPADAKEGPVRVRYRSCAAG